MKNFDHIKLHVKDLEALNPSAISPLVMLHGWGKCSENLLPLAHLLQASCRIKLIDLPGFGLSPPPEEVWTTEVYADCIANHLKREKIEKISLLGHSFGGKISIVFAEKYPEMMDRLILIASSGLKPDKSFLQRRRADAIRIYGKFIKGLDKLFKKNYYNMFVERYGSRDYKAAKGVMRDILVSTVNNHCERSARQVTTPTLILWGAKDAETKPSSGYQLHQLISGSQFILFPQKDHFPFSGVGSHLCASYIIPFLKDKQ